MKAFACVLMIGAALLGGGCTSVLTNRYLQAQNPALVEVAPDGSKVLLGVDVFALDQVIDHPWMTTGAALVDAATMYGVYALGENQEWWGSSDDGGDDQAPAGSAAAGPGGSSASAPAGGEATSININVDHNEAPVTIHVGDATTEMAAPAE